MKRAIAVALTAILLLVGIPPNIGSATGASAHSSRTTLAGEMVPAIANASSIHSVRMTESRQPLAITVTLARTDQRGFDRYLAQVTDPASPAYGRYLTRAHLAARFGPSQSAYDRVIGWLRSQGLSHVQGSANRLTVTVRGTRARAETAFATRLQEYELAGRRVYANASPPSVPRAFAGSIAAVSGLSDVGHPLPLSRVSSSSGVGASTRKNELRSILERDRMAQLVASFRSAERRSSGLRVAMSGLIRAAGKGSGVAYWPAVGAPTGGRERYAPSAALASLLNRLRRSPGWSRVAREVRRLEHSSRMLVGSGTHNLMAGPATPVMRGSPAPTTTASGLTTLATTGAGPYPEGSYCIHFGSCFQWKGNSDCFKNLLNGLAIGAFVPGYATAFVVEMIALYLSLSVGAFVAAAGVIGLAWSAFACLDLRITWNGHEIYYHPGPSVQRHPDQARSPFASKIGLLEFDGFHTSDVSDWMNLLHLTSTNLSKQLSVVPIGGGVGSPGPGESEVLLDLDTIFSLNPAANIAVYEGGSGASFEQLFNAMINAHDTVISNSWAQCEDQTSPAEARAIDSVLSQAEASGITVFNGSGDNGTTCLDGSTNTVAVPADSPHALAVGGTTPVFGPALSYAGERWWGSGSNNPPDGQGGYGVSKYFSRPPYQSGVTSAGGRSVPDIVIDADPTAGIEICQADAGGCPDGLLSGGTSMAAPEIAALVAGLDQAAGRTLKIGPATAYGLAKTRPASFQTAAALKTDFAHVGLGFPDLNQWYMALTGTNTGSVSPNRSTAVGSIGMTGSKPTGAVSVMLRGTNGESVGGKRVSLTLVGGGHAVVVTTSGLSNPIDGSVTFAIRDSVPETVHFTVRDTTDKITLAHQPSVAFVSPSATAGSINATLLSVPADGKSSTTVTVTLQSAQGKPSAGKTVSVSEGAGHAIITGVGSQPGVTNSQGKAQFQVVDLTAETVTFTATDGSDGDLPVPGSATVVFTTGNGSNQCPAQTPTATKGFALSPFASGFFDGGLATFVGCGGVGTPAWDSSGNLYVPDFITGDIYKLGPGGGSPGPSTKITRTPLGPYLFGLAFGKKGELYADQWFTPSGSSVPCGCIYQVNPSTGAIERTVAQSVPLTSFSVDPISGDLFAFSGYNGGQNYNPDIYRIHDPGAGKPAVSCASPAPGTACSIYSTQGSLDYAVFDADGTIYARGCSTCGLNADTWMIDGTNSKTPGTATLLDSTIPGGGGPIVLKSGSGKKLAQIAIGDSSNSAAYMVDQVDLNRRPFRPVGLAQDLAPLTLGPDGCLYVEDSNSIFKLTTTGHTCPYPSPVSTRPGLTLTQSGPGGPTGSSVTLSARLQGVKNLAGNKITFSILGANTQGKLLASGSSGDARFTYQGIRPGVDTVMAMVMVGNKPLTSDSVYVHWAAGRHATFTGLNLSPQSGRVGQRLKFTASLTDITAGPAGPLGGQTVSLTLAGSHCGQKTDSHGLASCMLTLPSHAGTYVLQANFAGTSKYAGSSGRSGISVHGGASPVTVWLGYAAGKSKHFPNPWQGAKGIRFIGAEPLKGKTWDTSGLRIKNSSQRAIRITQVSVQFPATGYTASPWGALTVSAGQTVILASTNKANSGNFDGSENAVRGTKCDVVATKDAPTVEIAIQGQITQTYTDGGHVLDAGGYNPSYCKENESETWRLPGAAAGPFK